MTKCVVGQREVIDITEIHGERLPLPPCAAPFLVELLGSGAFCALRSVHRSSSENPEGILRT